MLTILNLVIYGFVALFILPLAVFSLVTGSQPPENTLFTKYYRAETRLMLIGNLFLITIGLTAILKLGRHFSVIDPALADSLDPWIAIPFMMLLVVFLAFFIRAFLKVRRTGQAE